MSAIVSEVKQTNFDLFTTMLFLQQNKRVGEIFTKKFGDDFKKHFLLIKEKLFTAEAVNFVQSIFTDIILANDNHVEEYGKLFTKPKVEKYKNVKRRIPLSEIKKTAKERGKLTENERAMVAGYELKNIVARIHNKGKLSLFTDEEARDVIATIETVKKRLASILKKR
jgi:hypothetical protein